MISYFGAVWVIFKKDITLEIHTREVISSMLFFSFLVLVIFNFAFEKKAKSAARGPPWKSMSTS